MERNVGGSDSTARLVGGPILLLVGVAALLGLVTGMTRKCILHQLLGVNTCHR